MSTFFSVRKLGRKSLIFFSAILFVAFLPLAFDNPLPIDPYLDGVFPDEDPATLTGQYKMEIAYPNLTFNDVSVITSAPNNDSTHPTNNLLFVGRVNGMVYAFDNNPSVQTSQLMTVLNHTGDVYQRGETLAATHPKDTWNHFLDGGLLNIVFHPDFGKPGSPNANYLYMQYTGVENGFNVVKVSRFTMTYNPLQIDPTSEQVLITVPKRGPSHYGGGMCFDNEGFFYVAFGDGMDPPFNNQANRDYFFNSIQELNTFYGKVLKIDLDMDPTRSHAPVNFLSTNYGGTSGNLYWIPNNNPFSYISGSLEEIYTIGNRAPHRMTYDHVDERIWEGEVGWNTREEVNIIEAGKNYQWPRFEGNLDNGQIFTNYTGTFPLGTPRAPTWDVVRPGGRYAIIGGHVYRGNDLPALNGKYICGMFGSGDIYAMTLDTITGISSQIVIASKAGDKEIHTFGLDQQGEIYAGGNGNDKIYKLVTLNQAGTPIPQTLSATGAFVNLSTLAPADGVIPYEPKNPFWSDGAHKYRWIALPNDGTHDSTAEDVVFSEKGNWAYPIGTVFVKHFEFEMTPGVFKKIETRFLIQDKNGNYYGLSYRWRQDQSDADLVNINGYVEPLTTVYGQHDWTYPGRSVCMNCHNGSRGFVLGVNTWQLNHELEYAPGQPENQLEKWNNLGMFSQDIGVANIPSFPQTPKISDTSADLEQRARIYLEVNCGYCHNPNSGTPANFDASFLTQLDETGLIYEVPGNNLGLPNPHIITPKDTARSVLFRRIHDVNTSTAMPPIAKSRIDQTGVDIIAEWIMSMDPNYRPDPLKPGLVLHHKMDEGIGLDSDDETSYKNHGTLINAPNWVGGQDSMGIAFDGNDDQIIIPHSASLQLTDEITMAAWIKVDNFGNWDGLITKGVIQSPYAMQIWGDGTIRFTVNWGAPTDGIGGGSWNSQGKLSLSTWHHVAISYNGELIKFFIDGQLDTQINQIGMVFGSGSGNLVLGADLPGGDEFFDGIMDEVRLYNKALRDELIEMMYYGNRPPIANFTFIPAGGNNPLAYTLDASTSSDPDGNALTYFWNLGDGETQIEPLFNHVFPTEGDYTVQLIVHDGEFRDTTTQVLSPVCSPFLPYSPLVNLTAENLILGNLSAWQNLGSLYGTFTPEGSSPVVQEVNGRKAVSFDGNQAMVADFLTPGSITGNGGYSVVLTVFNPAIDAGETVFSWGHRGGPNGTNAQFMYGNNPVWGAIGHWGPSDIGFDGGVPSAGNWHQIVYTYEGGTNSSENIYVNGVLNAQENKTLNIHPNQPFQIGAGRINALGGFIEYFEGAISSISVYQETLTPVEINLLTIEPCPDIATLQIKVMLEGAYSSGLMDPFLNQSSLLSQEDPYGFNRTLASGMLSRSGNQELVDWVKIELRDANDSTIVMGTKVALVQKDGQVVDVSGSPDVIFPGLPKGSYFVAINHYNHLGAMTAQAIDMTSTPLIDFTNPSTAVYSNGGTAMRNISGVMVLWAGDANGDGTINVVDKNNFWRLENGQPYQYGTSKADFNLDGVINAVDRNTLWRVNNSMVEQLP